MGNIFTYSILNISLNQHSHFDIISAERDAQDLDPEKKDYWGINLKCSPMQKKKEKTEKLKGPNVLHVALRDRMFKTLPPPVVYLWIHHHSTASGMFYFPSIVHQDVYL